jgi:hypothetical protein
MGGIGIRRLFLLGLIASLSVTALLAIAVLLVGSFDETAGRILATTALLAGFSLFATPAGILLDQNRAVALAWAGIALATLALAGVLVLVWGVIEDSEGAWRAVGGIIALAFGAAQLSTTTGWLRPGDSRVSTRLYQVSLGTGAVFVALVCTALAVPVEDDETFFRVLGAVAVLNLLVVLLQPFVRRLTATPSGEDERVVRTYAVRCTVEGAPSVDRRLAAQDFAAAVERAVRELEAEGARVTKIERLDPAEQG